MIHISIKHILLKLSLIITQISIKFNFKYLNTILKNWESSANRQGPKNKKLAISCKKAAPQMQVVDFHILI